MPCALAAAGHTVRVLNTYSYSVFPTATVVAATLAAAVIGAATAGCAGDHALPDESVQAQDLSGPETIFVAAGRSRTGFDVRPANGGRSVCADGRVRSACPVRRADFAGMGLSPTTARELGEEMVHGSVLVRGRFVTAEGGAPEFLVTDAFRAPEEYDATSDERYFAVSGAASPFQQGLVNRTGRRPIAEVDFDAQGFEPAQKALATRAMAEGELIVIGFYDDDENPRRLVASSFFTKVAATDSRR